MISEERKKELIAVIKQQERMWAENYAEASNDITASREIAFSEPILFCTENYASIVQKTKLMVRTGRYGDSRVCFYSDTGEKVYLTDVIENEDIPDDADSVIGMALSFMSNELSVKWVQNLKTSPTNDPVLNIFAKLFKR